MKEVSECKVAYTETGSVSCVLKRPAGHVVTTVVLAGCGLDTALHARLGFDSLVEARKAYRRGLLLLEALPDAIPKQHATRWVTRDRWT